MDEPSHPAISPLGIYLTDAFIQGQARIAREHSSQPASNGLRLEITSASTYGVPEKELMYLSNGKVQWTNVGGGYKLMTQKER